MILRRDPIHVLTLAVSALAVVSGAAVCVMGWQFWRYEKGGPWSWLAVYFAGIVMVLTWTLIILASEPPEIVNYPQKQELHSDNSGHIKRLPPEGFHGLTLPGPIAWPNIQPIKLHETIQATLKLEYVSFRSMRDHTKLTDREIPVWKDWLERNGMGKVDGRGGVVITPEGKADLERLSPFARGLR